MEFEFRVLVEHYPTLARGLLGTLEAIALSLFIGILLGLIFCIGSLSDSRPVYRLSRAYIDFFRVTPEITLIFWVYFCLPPILDVTLSALASGVLALSLVTGAFLAEIFRAGILAIPRGQVEAALALGIPAFHRWRRIIIPPAVRRMMPAFVNYFTELLKHSTLLSGIGVAELTYQAFAVGSETYRYLEALSAIAIAYFIVIFPLSLYVRRSERARLRRTGQ